MCNPVNLKWNVLYTFVFSGVSALALLSLFLTRDRISDLVRLTWLLVVSMCLKHLFSLRPVKCTQPGVHNMYSEHYNLVAGPTLHLKKNRESNNEMHMAELKGKSVGFLPVLGRRVFYFNNAKSVKFIFVDAFGHFLRKPGTWFISDLLGEGIFTSDMPLWKHQRKAASKMFSLRNLKNFMFDCVVSHSGKTMKIIKETSGKAFDLNALLGFMTLDCFIKIAFGQSSNVLDSFPAAHPFSDSFDHYVANVGKRLANPLFPLFSYLNIGIEKELNRDLTIINQFISEVCRKRNAPGGQTGQITDETGVSRFDLMSLFLKNNPSMSEKEVRDTAMNFVLAGRDTTRTLLSWFFYAMHLNRECEEKVKEEIRKYSEADLEDETKGLRYTVVEKGLPYTNACLLETLRMWPAVPFLMKFAKQAIQVPTDGQPVHIKKHDICMIHTLSFGRIESIYPNPDRFEPTRWVEKGVFTLPAHQYPFFNLGPRICLGRNFALLQAKTFLYTFYFTFDSFTLTDPESVKTMIGPILNMQNGLKMQVR